MNPPPVVWNWLRHSSPNEKLHRALRRLEARLRRSRRNRARSRRKLLGVGRDHVDGHRGDTQQLKADSPSISVPRDASPRLTSEPTLIVPSLLLRDSFRLATERPEEGMHFMASIEIDGVSVAVKIVEFPYTRRTVVGAAGDHRATHRAVIELLELGHRIGGLFHSHPGEGVAATHPSRIDFLTHRQWEMAAPLAGGIFSRDGFVRWYWADRPVRVRVIGDGVEEVEPNVWRLLTH